MKFIESLTPESILFGLGLAAVTSVLGPVIKRNTKDMAVKGTQGALMAGNKLTETKDKMTKKITNKSENNENQVSTQELLAEMKKEREQIQELINTFNDLKQELSNQNETQN